MNKEIPSNPNADSKFEFYEKIVKSGLGLAPQRQGLTEEEYLKAVDDNRVALTDVETAQVDTLRIPQLLPVELNGWLNSGYYRKRFPNAYDRDALRYYSDLGEVAPGQSVVAALKDLAKKQGVVVFDYPTSDPGYTSRLTSFLQESGIILGEHIDLGYQSYFAGQVVLKKGYDKSKPSDDLGTAMSRVQSRYEGNDSKAVYRASIDETQAKKLHAFYKEAFDVLNDHPCRQGLDTEEFFSMMRDESSVYKILYPEAGEVETVILLGDDLDKFSWIDHSFYATNFPERWAARQILYYPALATDPSKSGGHNTAKIVDLIAQGVEEGNNPILVAFDCCDNNEFLAPMLEGVINATPEASIDFDEVGRQQYAAVTLAA